MSDFKPVLQNPIGLLIEPLDALMFRDARPFHSTDCARSVLPTPQTLAGMIRTHAMQALGVAPAKLHGLRNDRSAPPWQRLAVHLAVRGPWLCRLNKDRKAPSDVFVPIPATLVQRGKGDSAPLASLGPIDPMDGWELQGNPCQDLKPLGVVEDGEPPRAVEKKDWLGKEALGKFLAGQALKRDMLLGNEDLFEREERTSLVVQPDTRTSDPGLIYSASFLRLKKDVAFYAEFGVESHAPGDVHGIANEKLTELIPAKGVVLPFGGEGRRVRVRPVASPWRWPEVDSPADGKCFTLMISPAIFYQKNGSVSRPIWQPPLITNLRAAAVPRPLAVSGFGLDGNDGISRASGAPRPMRYAVPAGAVYFWERGRNAESNKPPLQGAIQLSESPQDRAAGWGIALKGVWK